MATAELESVAEFKRRASALGVTEDHLKALVAAGFDTFGKYAFSVPYVPGAADERPLVELLKKTFGANPKDSELACLRRLFWESHALALADLKQRQEHGSESITKKLPTSERVARAQEQKKRLSGVIWGPDTEPSDQLVDRFVQMAEENVVTYVKPELCTSRSQEILQVKQAKSFAIGSDGNLKVGHSAPDFTCATTGELRLRAALHRKALALDLSGILSYKAVELWRTRLFTCLQRDSPPGYKPITINQIMEADKRLWVLLSERTRGDVIPKLGSPAPCDSEFAKLTDSQEILSFLAPLPRPPAIPDPSRQRWAPYPDPKGKGKGKEKGKESNKGAGAPAVDLPEGAKTKTEDGKPLCFAFNRGRCWRSKKVKPGKRCPKGFHKCWICLRDRPATECTHSD